jgi:carboxypeptidase C (cathepsin A)
VFGAVDRLSTKGWQDLYPKRTRTCPQSSPRPPSPSCPSCVPTAEVSEDDRAAPESDALKAAAALPADARAVTQHVLPSPTGDLGYEATAAALTLKDDKGRPSSRIFYIAYVRQGSEPRPLTFVFNGGPGAASAYLHLGRHGAATRGPR